jgi:hypothetical protein
MLEFASSWIINPFATKELVKKEKGKVYISSIRRE